jgi:ankyrin
MALHSAASAGDARRVRELLALGADVRALDGTGSTPLLSVAAAYEKHDGDAEVAQLLLDHGAPVDARAHTGWSPLSAAVHTGKHEVLRVLLRAGAVVDATSGRALTPLGLAAQGCDAAAVALLLDAGAQVSLRGRHVTRGTALSSAAEQGCKCLDVMRLLLARGADVHAALATDNITPLHAAAGSGCAPAVLLLLDAGAARRPCQA